MRAHALVGLLFLCTTQAAALESRVYEALAARGWGPDALLVAHNVLRHEPALAPRGAPPIVRELLAAPLGAADARALFDRYVPKAFELPPAAADDFETLLARYLAELEDRRAFLQATARFVGALRAAGARFPSPHRRETTIGTVVVGSPGPDRHGPGAALIIDPAGDDVYERAPPARGAISVIIDLAGDDRYGGADLAREAHSALVDVSGNDRYAMTAGLGAARGGVSLLLDLAGDDEYRVQSHGQGYAAEGGLGVLWDRAGDDVYIAAGLPDAWGREGGQSYAQGAASGERDAIAGGVGILRDDQGDDRYEAQMFAQGMGYYFGLGLLWDRGGNDRYVAVRYAQGAGVHQAVGALRDEGGDDAYALRAGVGQGVGHDMAVGVLIELAGEDRYEAPYLAHGSASANGVGLLADLAGRSVFAPAQGPGEAQPLRGLPSIGILLQDAPRASLVRAEPAAPAAAPSAAQAAERCAPPLQARLENDAPLDRMLLALAPGVAAGTPDPKAYGEALARLIDFPDASLREVTSFDAAWVLGELLPCALVGATPAQAEAMYKAFARLITEEPSTRHARAIAEALRRRPAPAPLQQELVAALDAHRSCAVRALAAAAWPRPERARSALGAACWQEQSAGLHALRRLGLEPPAAALPSFLR